eukprot:jgi/Mesvir1/2659/Mv16264-RA.1
MVMYVGSDSNHGALKACYARLIREYGEVLEAEGVHLGDGRRVPVVRMLGGGDKAYVNAERGQAGCSHQYPCNKCTCPKAKFGDLEASKHFSPRTVQLARELAHDVQVDPTAPFKCPSPHCGKVFHTQAELRATEPRNESKAGQHARDHFGQKWGCTPLLPVEHCEHPTCLLHCLLNNVCALLDRTIMARMHKGEEAEMLKVLHDEMGVFIKEKYVKAPSKNASAKAVEKPHVIGREAETLLDKFHLCVNIVCQHNADEDAESHVDREELTRVWQGLKDVWEALCDFDDDGPGGPKREAKAAEVEELAATYVASFISFTAPEHVTTYMHDLVAHIPSQIRELGDLRLFSGEALEHLHHVNKVTYAHRSNKRVKTGTDKRGRAMGVGALAQSMHAGMVRQELAHRLCMPLSYAEQRARKRMLDHMRAAAK